MKIFGKVLTKIQCIQYALDKHRVMCVIPEIRGKGDIKEVFEYINVTDEEKDYSIIGNFTPKYYDLALAGDKLAVENYKNLERNAKDCISCGHCNFKVDQISRMKEISKYFANIH